MKIHTSLWAWYALLNEEYLNVVKVFSISTGIGVAKRKSIKKSIKATVSQQKSMEATI